MREVSIPYACTHMFVHLHTYVKRHTHIHIQPQTHLGIFNEDLKTKLSEIESQLNGFPFLKCR